MDSLFSLVERLLGVALNLLGVWMALHERADAIGWAKALRATLVGAVGCSIVASIGLMAGNSVPSAEDVVPATVSTIQIPHEELLVVEKPLGVLPYGLALLFAPLLFLMIKDTWSGSSPKHRSMLRK